MRADAAGELARGIENVEFACGIPALLKGGFSEQAATDVDVHSVRQPLGVVAGITPFNFPAMVPLWMFADCDRVRQHVRLEAEREGSVRVGAARRAAGGGRPARRRPQRRPRRRGRGEPHPRASRHRRGELRRLDADRVARLHDRHRAREAGAGARRGEEPHGRAPRRRHRRRRRRRGFGGVRIGRRAVHGGLGRRRGGRRGRPDRATRSPTACRSCASGPAPIPSRRWDRSSRREHRDRVASYLDDRAGEGARVVVDGREQTVRRRRLLPRRVTRRRRTARDAGVRRRDLRPRARGRAGRHLRRSAPAGQRQPVRQRLRDLHPRRRRGPAVRVRRRSAAWSA